MEDITGKTFSRLMAISPAHIDRNNGQTWNCSCVCGNVVIVPTSQLKNGHTKSCGCLKIEKAKEGIGRRSTIHGECKGRAKTRLYRVWCQIHYRCNNKNSQDYKWYGQKGITVCDEWSQYQVFKEWSLSNGYQEGLTIDRIDSSRGYTPDNCQWLTNEENVKRSRYEKIHGKPQVYDTATGANVTDQYR